MTRTVLSFALLTLIGCGSPDAHDAHAQKEAGAAKQAPAKEGAKAAPDSVQTFHGALKPLWHAAAGPQRTTDTCNAVPKLKELAAAMKATPPAGAKPDYAGQVTGLETALGGLATECATPERAKFDDTFHAVHEAFHGVAEACND